MFEGMGMSLGHLAGWAAITFVAGALFGSVGIVVWIAASGAAYYVSCWLHPRRNCWSCRGTGRHTGMIWGYSRRACGVCGGNGWRRRLGAKLFNITGIAPDFNE